jgi:hypothetical protein
MTNRINFSVVPFPQIQFSGDVNQLAQLLADHLQGNLDQSVFTGQDGGTMPQTNIGLWLDNDIWKIWDTILATYVPIACAAGAVTNGVLHVARMHANNETADIDLQLPSLAGTIARIEDITAPLAPGTNSGNTINLDWTVTDFYAQITAAATVVDPGTAVNGASLVLWIETPVGHGTALTVAFPSTWIVDSAILGTTDATHRAVDQFVIRRIGTKTFVHHEALYSINQGGPGGDTSPPVVSLIDAIVGHSAVRVHWLQLMQGPTPVTDWIVKKDGTNVPISVVNVSGTLVQVVINSPIVQGSVYTIQYTGSSLKDVAGNLASHFGPWPVSLVQN